MDKPNKKDSKFPPRCRRCQYFNIQKDKCKKNKDKCIADYSKCDSFLIREGLVMY